MPGGIGNVDEFRANWPGHEEFIEGSFRFSGLATRTWCIRQVDNVTGVLRPPLAGSSQRRCRDIFRGMTMRERPSSPDSRGRTLPHLCRDGSRRYRSTMAKPGKPTGRWSAPAPASRTRAVFTRSASHISAAGPTQLLDDASDIGWSLVVCQVDDRRDRRIQVAPYEQAQRSVPPQEPLRRWRGHHHCLRR